MGLVYVVHQVHADIDNSGRLFDEEKVMLGFDSLDEALKAYYEHGPAWGVGGVTTLPIDEFKTDWLKRGPLRGHDPLMFGGTP